MSNVMLSTAVFAPGKLVLTGAYAVLEGAPAIAVAVSRGAYAYVDASKVTTSPTPEVAAAFGSNPAPYVDASAMFSPGGDRKLGLGASAAILVASLATRVAMTEDLSAPSVRESLFVRARNAHAMAQGGGSGVDIAASVHGGAIQYVMGEPAKSTRAVTLPAGVRISVFACATSARTSDLRAEITRLASTRPDAHRACMKNLVAIAEDAAVTIQSADAKGFIESVRRTARGLAALGEAANCAIVPSGFEDLEKIANAASASFCVSGAGGGDVAVWIGTTQPSSLFHERALRLGLTSLDDIAIDTMGVRLAPSVNNSNTPRPAPRHEDLQP